MSIVKTNESLDWFDGSRKDLFTNLDIFPKTSAITFIENSQQLYQPFTNFTSESNKTVLTRPISISRNQTTFLRANKQGELERRIESIIGAVIFERKIASSVNITLLQNHLIRRFKSIGLNVFLQVPDDVIKKRIEKVVAIELLKNLFSDIKEDEFDLIKIHSKSKGFFR